MEIHLELSYLHIHMHRFLWVFIHKQLPIWILNFPGLSLPAAEVRYFPMAGGWSLICVAFFASHFLAFGCETVSGFDQEPWKG